MPRRAASKQLRTMSECVDIPRHLFGFHRKPKGSHLDAALSFLSTETAPSQRKSFLQYQVLSALYLENKLTHDKKTLAVKLLTTKIQQHFGYVTDLKAAYEIWLPVATFSLAAAFTGYDSALYTSRQQVPGQAWKCVAAPEELLMQLRTMDFLLQANNKTLVQYLSDITEEFKRYHHGFWTFDTQSFVQNTQLHELDVNNRETVFAALLTVAPKELSLTASQFIQQAMQELGVSKQHTYKCITATHLIHSWQSQGGPDTGFFGLQTGYKKDPFADMPVTALLLTDAESTAIDNLLPAAKAYILAAIICNTKANDYAEHRKIEILNSLVRTALLPKEHIEGVESYQNEVAKLQIATNLYLQKTLQSKVTSFIQRLTATVTDEESVQFNATELIQRIFPNVNVRK
jgi:hypothetical protein